MVIQINSILMVLPKFQQTRNFISSSLFGEIFAILAEPKQKDGIVILKKLGHC